MRRVPIFPLPETVFFPGTTLPLHLFEPRYRQMGEDAIAGNGELVVVLLKPGWEKNYEGTPPVHDIATLGTIEDHETLPDGRYNITLRGTERVRLLAATAHTGELRAGKLYRERAIESAPERCPSLDDDEAVEKIARLRVRWEELQEKSGRPGGVDVTSPPSRFDVFVNRIADTIDIPPQLKQTLLEEADLLARAARVEAFMGEQLKFWRTLATYRDLKPEDPSVN